MKRIRTPFQVDQGPGHTPRRVDRRMKRPLLHRAQPTTAVDEQGVISR